MCAFWLKIAKFFDCFLSLCAPLRIADSDIHVYFFSVFTVRSRELRFAQKKKFLFAYTRKRRMRIWLFNRFREVVNDERSRRIVKVILLLFFGGVFDETVRGWSRWRGKKYLLKWKILSYFDQHQSHQCLSRVWEKFPRWSRLCS